MSMVQILLSRTGWNKTKVTEDVDLILLTLTAGFALVYYIVKFKHKPKYVLQNVNTNTSSVSLWLYFRFFSLFCLPCSFSKKIKKKNIFKNNKFF